jgi:hypothetical protein
MNYWRNNGAIRAANQYMEQEIVRLGSNNIRILDTHGIIQPRFIFEEFVCVDHFMCNDPPRGLIITPSGVALATEVLIMACESTGGANFKSGKNYYKDDVRYVDSTFHACYIVSSGCRRLIPDHETFNYMKFQLSSFEPVSPQFLSEIPTCHRPEYPSRKSGTLLQVYSSKSVYIMDSGKRRPINKVNVLTELGLTFDNVTFILEEDFNLIPEGSPISSKSECIECGK